MNKLGEVEVGRINLFKVMLYAIPVSLIAFFVSLSVHPPHKFLFDADWGMQLAFADPILSGEHPFIDYFGGAGGPLLYYLTALAQYLSGQRLIGEIILCILGHSIGFFFLWRLLIHITKSYPLSILALLWALMLMPKTYKYGITLGPATLLYCAYKYIHEPNRKKLTFLALASVLSLFLRIDFGAHAFLGALGTIAVVQISNKKFSVEEFLRFFFIYLSCLLPYILFLTVAGGNVFEAFLDAYTALTTAGGGLVKESPVFDFSLGLTNLKNIFALSYWLVAIFPILAIGFGIAFFKKTHKEEAIFSIVLGLFCSHFFMQVSHRADLGHLMQVQFVYLIGACIFILGPLEVGIFKRLIFITYAVLFLFAGTYFFDQRNPHPISERIKNFSNYPLFYLKRNELRAKMLKRYKSEKYRWRLEMLDYVSKNTKKDEKVFFIPFKAHNYYFSERRFAGNFPILIPGFRTSKEEQEKLIELFKKQNVELVIDFPLFMYDNDPKKGARSFSKVFMDYIDEQYIEVASFKYAKILKKSP